MLTRLHARVDRIAPPLYDLPMSIRPSPLLLTLLVACLPPLTEPEAAKDDTEIGEPTDTQVPDTDLTADTDLVPADTDPVDTDVVDTDVVDTDVVDTDVVDTDPPGVPLADFSLPDLNQTSPRFGEPVSPRDYLQKVSGWYVTHAT